MFVRPDSSELGNCEELASALALCRQLRSSRGLFPFSRPDSYRNISFTTANQPWSQCYEAGAGCDKVNETFRKLLHNGSVYLHFCYTFSIELIKKYGFHS